MTQTIEQWLEERKDELQVLFGEIETMGGLPATRENLLVLANAWFQFASHIKAEAYNMGDGG